MAFAGVYPGQAEIGRGTRRIVVEQLIQVNSSFVQLAGFDQRQRQRQAVLAAMRHRQCLAVLADGFLVEIFGHQGVALLMEMLCPYGTLGPEIIAQKATQRGQTDQDHQSMPASSTTGLPICGVAEPGALCVTVPKA